MRRVHGDGRWSRSDVVSHAHRGRAGPQGENGRRSRHRRKTRPDAARLHRRAGRPMRLLHPRHDDARAGAARNESRAVASRDQAALEREPLPLRHAHAHRPRGRARRRVDEKRRPRSMSTDPFVLSVAGAESKDERLNLPRRNFLIRSGTLVVSFSLAPRVFGADAGEPKKAPQLPGSLKNAPMLDSWIRIDAKGAITVFTGK